MFSKKKIILISDSKVKDIHLSGFSQFLMLIAIVALVAVLVWLPFKAGKNPNFTYNDAQDADLYNLLEDRLGVVEGDVNKLSKQILEVDKYKDYISTKPKKKKVKSSDKSVSNSRAEAIYDKLVKLEGATSKLTYSILSKTNQDGVVLEKVLSQIGYDYETIVGRKPPTGADKDLGLAIGGPYEPAKAADLVKNTTDEQVENKIRYINDLKNIVYFLPLANPMNTLHKTSSFGVRRDPFSKTYANHSGIDFVDHKKPQVKATAPGKVSFAGYTNGYGNLVKIDHGYGFETRYAHLKEMNVSTGETVERGQQIGIMGSTGRSTGAHLHYEVRNNGVAFDPQNFLNAGKNVVFK